MTKRCDQTGRCSYENRELDRDGHKICQRHEEREEGEVGHFKQRSITNQKVFDMAAERRSQPGRSAAATMQDTRKVATGGVEYVCCPITGELIPEAVMHWKNQNI